MSQHGDGFNGLCFAFSCSFRWAQSLYFGPCQVYFKTLGADCQETCAVFEIRRR